MSAIMLSTLLNWSLDFPSSDFSFFSLFGLSIINTSCGRKDRQLLARSTEYNLPRNDGRQPRAVLMTVLDICAPKPSLPV